MRGRTRATDAAAAAPGREHMTSNDAASNDAASNANTAPTGSTTAAIGDAAARPTVTIRSRTTADADALVAILADVHASDQYPMMAEHISSDWLFDPAFAAAWVAVVDGAVVGHIAVQAGYGGPEFEAVLQRPASETLGITRFFVAATGRGSGAASALLDAVDQYASTQYSEHDSSEHDSSGPHADARGVALALDVLEVNEAAMRLYERRGWRKIGSHTTDWFGPDGPHPTVFLYVK